MPEDVVFKESLDTRTPLFSRKAFEAPAPLIERPADRLGLGLARQPRHVGDEALPSAFLMFRAMPTPWSRSPWRKSDPRAASQKRATENAESQRKL